MTEDEIRSRILVLIAEMEDWMYGRRSWTNLRVIGGLTETDISIIDAQEVVKRSAAIQAYQAMLR